ncbi:MAG: hypothetical protein ACKUBY_04960 [Candidatus Moraniibacteriota bacterium]|jgi:hypothetical protein
MQIKKGTALVYGLIVIVSVAVIFTGLIRFVTEHFKYSLHAQPRQQALHMAESGIYFYRWYLGHNVDGKTAEEVADFWENGNPYGVDSDNDGECSESEAYEVDYDGTNTIGRYRICVIRPSSGSTDAEILATGWTYKEPDVTRSVRVRMRRPAWSEFVLLSDSSLIINNKTTFYGAVHANDGIEFNGSAYGAVSSSVATYDHDNNSATEEKEGIWSQTGNGFFAGAKIFPSPVQDFNSIVVSFAEIASAAQGQYTLPTLAGGQGWHIILQADGTADVWWVKKHHKDTKAITKESFDQTITLQDTSAIYLRNDLWIDGTLDAGKRLTIAAHHNGGGRNQDIYINGDVVYENHDSWTVLGLAAENNIDTVKEPIIDGAGNDSGVLEIDAAILSQFGFVGRSSEYDTIIDMDFYGAIATKQGLEQSSVGTSTLTYDPNFLVTAPPYFPTGSSYVIDQWTEME